MLVLCLASVADGGPELDQHRVNVSCLLGVLTGHICVLHIIGCEDNKTVAQLIEPKDDLVAVDHLPGSKTQQGLRDREHRHRHSLFHIICATYRHV